MKKKTYSAAWKARAKERSAVVRFLRNMSEHAYPRNAFSDPVANALRAMANEWRSAIEYGSHTR